MGRLATHEMCVHAASQGHCCIKQTAAFTVLSSLHCWFCSQHCLSLDTATVSYALLTVSVGWTGEEQG